MFCRYDLEEMCPHCDHLNYVEIAKTKTHNNGKKTIVCQNCGKEIFVCNLCDCENCGNCKMEV